MQWSMKHQLPLHSGVGLRSEHFFLLKPILEDLYVLIYTFIRDCLWLVRVIRASNHYFSVKHVWELFASLWSSISTVGRIRFLSEDNLSILVMSLEDTVHHVFAFVLNSKITDQLLGRDELWIFHQVVCLTVRKLLLCSGIGDQVLTWSLDGECSRLDEVALPDHTGRSGVSLLQVLRLS